jgi:hypothetical protein
MGDLNKWWCVHSGGLEDEVHLMRPDANAMNCISETPASGQEEASASAAPAVVAAAASTLSMVKAILTKIMKLHNQGGPTSGVT